MIDTLGVIHGHNIIHRDISSDNIMVLRDGQLKLMDFGAAREMNYSDQKSVSVLLKSGYAPEEQYRPKGLQGPWTDVYAFCATIYKCITGVTPDDALERKHQDGQKWPSDLGISITPQLEAVLKRGMAVQQENRYQSFVELKNAIEIATGDGLTRAAIPSHASNQGNDVTVFRERDGLKQVTAGVSESTFNNQREESQQVTETTLPQVDASELNREQRGAGKRSWAGLIAVLAALAVIGMALFLILSRGVDLSTLSGSNRQESEESSTASVEASVSESSNSEVPSEAASPAAKNISPFFSHPEDKNYWIYETPYICVELERAGIVPNGYALEDGWAHFDVDGRLGMDSDFRRGETNCYNNICTVLNPHLKPMEHYTFLIEIRNCRFDAGDSFLVWPVTMAELDERNDQFYNAAEAIVTGDGSYRIYAQALADFGESTRMTDGYIYVNQDTSVSFDIRISLYEGNYDGDYIPYV